MFRPLGPLSPIEFACMTITPTSLNMIAMQILATFIGDPALVHAASTISDATHTTRFITIMRTTCDKFIALPYMQPLRIRDTVDVAVYPTCSMFQCQPKGHSDVRCGILNSAPPPTPSTPPHTQRQIFSNPSAATRDSFKEVVVSTICIHLPFLLLCQQLQQLFSVLWKCRYRMQR